MSVTPKEGFMILVPVAILGFVGTVLLGGPSHALGEIDRLLWDVLTAARQWVQDLI